MKLGFRPFRAAVPGMLPMGAFVRTAAGAADGQSRCQPPRASSLAWSMAVTLALCSRGGSSRESSTRWPAVLGVSAAGQLGVAVDTHAGKGGLLFCPVGDDRPGPIIDAGPSSNSRPELNIPGQ